MSRDKLPTETASGSRANCETRCAHQRERKYDGETGDVWNPTRFSILIFVFEEHPIESR